MNRRDFLRDVGAGVVAAHIGSGLGADLGFSTAFAQQGTNRLTFGNLDPLVNVMQETTAANLMPQIVQRLNNGTPLSDIVAAAALANARTFGGEDYIGFHTLMAIAPAYHMAQELPAIRRALPVLKVLHRNATRIQAHGGINGEILHPIQAGQLPAGRVPGEVLRDHIRQCNLNAATPESTFAACATSADAALNSVLYAMQDGAEVHRTVLPYRAWDLMSIIGTTHAHTLLRQSVRYCVRAETENTRQHFGAMRTMVPRLLDDHNLIGRQLGARQAEDAWILQLSDTIFRATPANAANAAAAALAEGFDPVAIGQAISLAANELILRDNGRTQDGGPGKPIGSIHGDSVGLHACDSANAWRNLASAANQRNKVVCLILGAWQAARDRTGGGAGILTQERYPRADAVAAVQNVQPGELLGALEQAIRGRNQARAAALVQRYSTTNLPVRPLWDLLLRYTISEDGALHHEKFYRTTVEEFNAARPAFKWRYLIALARVTASGHGYPAPGHAQACQLLGI
jgi:hypothetical protein